MGFCMFIFKGIKKYLTVIFTYSLLLTVFTSPSWAGRLNIEDIDFSDIQKAYLIVVKPGKLIGSGNGHTALRLVGPNTDVVINFVANATADDVANLAGKLKAIGIGGILESDAYFNSFENFKDTYTAGQDREITSYELNLTQQELEQLVQYTQKVTQDGPSRPYNIISYNCTTMTSEALSSSTGITVRGLAGTFPLKIAPYLEMLGKIRDAQVEPSHHTLRDELREDIASLTFPSEIAFMKTKLLEEFNSEDQNIRILAIAKLKNLANHAEANLETRMMADLIARRLIDLEPKGSKYFSLRFIPQDQLREIYESQGGFKLKFSTPQVVRWGYVKKVKDIAYDEQNQKIEITYNVGPNYQKYSKQFSQDKLKESQQIKTESLETEQQWQPSSPKYFVEIHRLHDVDHLVIYEVQYSITNRLLN